MAALNPPPPAGATLWKRPVPPEMTTWASGIVHDPAGYPMGATETRDFSGVTALARVEWHNNRAGVPIATPIRGVTIYELGAGASPGGAGQPKCQAMSFIGQSCPLPPDGAPAGSGVGKALAFGIGGAVAYFFVQWALETHLARA